MSFPLKQLMLLALLLFFGNSVFAQSQEAKLQKELRNADDKTRGSLHLKLGEHYTQTGELELAESHIDSSIAVFKELSINKLLAKSYLKKGVIKVSLNQIDSAISYLVSSADFAKKANDSSLIYSTYSYCSGLHSGLLKDYSTALMYQDSADLFLPANSPKEKIYGHVIKSSIYNSIQEYRYALIEANKGIDLSKQNDNLYITHLFSNKGIALEFSKDYDAAMRLYEESLSYNDGDNYKANVYANMAGMMAKKELLDSALYFNKRAYSIFKKNNKKFELNQVLIGLTELFIRLNERDSAKHYWSEIDTTIEDQFSRIQFNALDFMFDKSQSKSLVLEKNVEEAIASGHLELAKTLSERLYNFNKEAGFPTKALHFLELNQVIRDSILSEQEIIRIQKEKVRSILEHKSQQIQQKERKNIELKYTIRQQKNLVYLFLSGVVVLVLLAILLIVYIRAQKQNLKLKEIEIENQKMKNAIVEKDLLNAKKLILHKNKLLQGFEEVQKNLGDDYKEVSEKLISKINSNQEWSGFMFEFETFYPQFIKSLKEQANSKLTQYDLRLASLLKLNLSNQEIAETLFIAPDSAKKAKIRLSKKLRMPEGMTVTEFIMTL